MASQEEAKTGENKTDLLLYLHNYSFYSQKVLLCLHEKGIPFSTHFVNIASGEQYQPSFLKINPKGEVPVIKDGDSIIIDSAKIIDYLEEESSYKDYPGLIPKEEGEEVMERHNHFHKIIHDLPADIITIGSFYHQNLVRSPKMPFLFPVRRHMKKITERLPVKLRKIGEELGEVSVALNAKAAKIEEDLAVMKDPVRFGKVLDEVDAVLKEVEEQLVKNQGSEKWLVSEKFTVADVSLTILLERLNQLGLEQRFWENRPNIAAYYSRVKQRESYKKSMPTNLFHLKTFIKAITYIQLV